VEKLAGRVALVTGAGRGIGRGIALAFADEGAAVCVAELDADSAAETAREAAKRGARALATRCDVSRRDDVAATVDRAVRELGGIDVLVNNATGARRESAYKPLLEHDDEDWQEKLAVDLMGSFYFMKACFPHLKQRRGSIINLCSMAGTERGLGFASYAATKEALRTLTGVAAREWGSEGIRANALCPSALTPGLKNFLDDNPDAVADALAKIPLGRMGDPETDIGRAAVFLASDDAAYMTGQTLWVDGGQVIRS